MSALSAQFLLHALYPHRSHHSYIYSRRRQIKGAGHDQAILSLQIDADLRSVFNWNVKQLFVYITAEYETEANVLNQVVIWDQIISEPQHAWIRSSSVANKYSLTDQGYGLLGNNVSLVVNWNTVPSTGLLTLSHAYKHVHSFIVPEEYSPREERPSYS